ncbi:MAG: aspartate/glutamate racemase family protein [Pseudomonadota bacterium]
MAEASGSGGAILLLNGNTTEEITARMVAAAAETVPGRAIKGRTAPFGEPYVSTAPAYAAASHAVATLAASIATERPVPGAVVVACFGDPGLAAARALLPCPVVGMAEASAHAACQLGRRFGIVTGGHFWGPMLEDFIGATGLGARLTGVETLELTGAEIAADPSAAERTVADAAERLASAGADTVILGGAGLVGFAARLKNRVSPPLLDSLTCAVTQAAALAETVRERQ